MSITRRIIAGMVQVIGGTLAAYIAAFLTIMSGLTELFEVGLIVGSLVGAAAIVGIGRLFGIRGRWWMAFIGAAAGAAFGYAVLAAGLAVNNPTLWAVLAVIPGVLATVAYHWSSRNAAPDLTHPTGTGI